MNMSYDDSNSNSSSEDDLGGKSVISPTIHFWILLLFSIPSIIYSFLVLWILLSNREQRRSLNQRIIIIQLIGGLIFLLTHVPIYLSYLRLGYVWPQTPVICQLGWFIGDGYIDTMTILMAWASFERHILVFHDQWMSTARRRFFLHYLPITIIILYGLGYYLVIDAFPFCENIYDYTQEWCSESCSYQNEIVILQDLIFNDILMTTLVAVLSISLIIRVLWHNHVRFHRRIHWRKHRRIIIILLAISTIYIVFNLPMMTLHLAVLCGLSEQIAERLDPYFVFLNYFVFISYPFICLGTFSKTFAHRRQGRVVGPSMLVMSQRPRPIRPVIHKQNRNTLEKNPSTLRV